MTSKIIPSSCRYRAINAMLMALAMAVLPGPGLRADGFSSDQLKQAVVKINVTSQQPDYLMPWQKTDKPVSASGSGFIVRGRRILTNAHVVSGANFIEVRRDADPRKYEAAIEFIGHDCDLAILRVDDEAFFENAVSLEMGDALPGLNDMVIVVGYPIGGERISVTRGVVSRIDYSLYEHSGVDSHLVIQVDAAINPGNSGGPALFDGKVVGLAFQGIFAAQNIGYAIALPVIRRFLADIEDGVYDGYPDLGVLWLDAQNPALRAGLALEDDHSGVLVTFVDPFASGAGILLPRDVILSIDGRQVAFDGTIRLDGHITEFVELLERKQCGESVALDVWRNGALVELTVPLRPMDDSFVFRREYGVAPEYFIIGGLVFSPLTRGYMSAIGGAPSVNAQNFRYYMSYAKLDRLHMERDHFTVLTMRLPHPCNTYAEPFLHAVVSSVNGRRIRRMKDMRDAVKFPEKGFHVFRFDGMDEILVLSAEGTASSAPAIMSRYGIFEPAMFRDEQSGAGQRSSAGNL